MIPGSKNLSIYKGDTFPFYARIQGLDDDGESMGYLDLTGCTPLAQIRSTADSATVLATFDCEIPAQTGDNLGRVNIRLEAEDTVTLVNGVWDLQLTWPNGDVFTYLAGKVSVIQDVSRV